MKDFEEGLAGSFTAAMLSGLICGILWETWNFRSISKWVYTVPFFEDIKIFEMPIPGYIGFPVFSLETIAFVNLLKGIQMRKICVASIVFASVAFSIFSFIMIDRYTVFSWAPKIEDLSFITKEKLDRFIRQGVETSYGIDTGLLDKNEAESIKLLHLKGLGMANFLKLKRHGINKVGDLSRLNDKTLSLILNETNLRRVRVYIRAANTGRE